MRAKVETVDLVLHSAVEMLSEHGYKVSLWVREVGKSDLLPYFKKG